MISSVVLCVCVSKMLSKKYGTIILLWMAEMFIVLWTVEKKNQLLNMLSEKKWRIWTWALADWNERKKPETHETIVETNTAKQAAQTECDSC